MKKGPGEIQIFLFVTVAFLFPAHFPNLQYESLGEVDYLPSKTSWENFDSENLLADSQEKAKAFPFSIFCLTGFLGANPLDELFSLPFPLSSRDQKTFILRC